MRDKGISDMLEIDGQGLTAEEMASILCDKCKNAPLTYYCPACDYKVCSDCMHKAFRKRRGAIVCKRCGHVDRKMETFVAEP